MQDSSSTGTAQVSRAQWGFGLATGIAVATLGATLIQQGYGGTGLIATGSVITVLNTWTSFAPRLRLSARLGNRQTGDSFQTIPHCD